MKVTIEQIQKGFIKFIDTEIINHLQGWQKIGFGATAALIIKNLPNIAKAYMNNPVVSMLGVIDSEEKIDVEAIHDALADYLTETGEYIDIPMFGRIKVTRQDLETLYIDIKENEQ